MKHFILLFVLLTSIVTKAQRISNLQLRGNVIDATLQCIIPGVKLTLQTKDSVTVGETFSYETGPENPNFIMMNVPGNGEYILSCEKDGYNTIYKNITLKYNRLRKPIVILDDIIMYRMMSRKLQEVKVTATLVKMVMKKDTVVYNADAFQLAEGSMLDQLVAQLPGVEIRENGQIFVNGKFVSSLLLNGEDFFKGNPSVALQNLPSYTVNQIKVYEKQSDRDMAMGLEKRGEQPLVMDVQLKKQYNVGWMLNTDVGAGIDQRYAAKLFGMRFSPKTRLSFFGNFNNLTDISSVNGKGEWINYNDPIGTIDRIYGGAELFVKNRKYKATHTLDVFRNKEEVDANTLSTTFFPTGDIYKRSMEAEHLNLVCLNFRNNMQWTPQNGFFFRLSPSLSYIRGKHHDWGRSVELTDNIYEQYRGEALDSLFSPDASKTYLKNLINRLSYQQNRNRSTLTGQINFNFSFRPKNFTRDYFTLYGNYNYNKHDENIKKPYEINYWNNGVNTDNEKKMLYNEMNSRNSSYRLGASYQFVLSSEKHYAVISPGYTFNYNYSHSERPFYEITDTTLWKHDVDQLSSLRNSLTSYMDWTNSYFSKKGSYNHVPGLNVQYSLKDTQGNDRLWIQIGLPLDILKEDLDYQRNMADTVVHRTTMFFNPSLKLKYYPDQRNRQYNNFEMSYKYNSRAQDLTYNIDYVDNSTPLEVWLTNPNLPDSHTHTLNLTYNWGNPSKQLRFAVYSNYIYQINALCQSLTYDATSGVRIYRPETINGNWIYNGGFNASAPIDKNRWFYFSTFTTWNYNHNVDYLCLNDKSNSIRNTVHDVTLRETLRLDFRKDKLSLGLRGNFYWTNATGKNISTINTFDYSYGLNGNWELPAGFGLSGDLMMYSRRGLETNQLNTDEFLCNLHLSKSILKGKLVFMLDGFDIFNQLSNIRYNINAQGQTEEYYNVVQSYAMLRVIYKFNRQPKKKN